MDDFHIIASICGLCIAGTICLYLIVLILKHTPRSILKSENYYITNTADGDISVPLLLPAIEDLGSKDPKLDLSLIIPCYNETSRLATMLEESVPILSKHFTQSKYEIILVDDGSKDGTAEFAIDWAAQNDLAPSVLKVCKLVKNRGKGGAIAHGMKFIQGNYALFADADGASKFQDFFKLYDSIKGLKHGIAIGSRAHMVNTEAVVKRSFIRNFLMYGLHTLVYIFGIKTIKDTQCGFKLFTRSTVKEIFPYMHTERWIFDVEILIIAIRKKIPIKEIAISWHEVQGSKIDLAKDSIQMAVDLIIMRFAYFFAIYRDS
jgi:dolichyl-phosphate beta-glucosyltransferase